jgi:N-hydroxyarylamine O-acetyltransferase
MTEEEVPVPGFDVHHRRMSTDPESSFVKTLVVQQPSVDRITSLRARTLSVLGPSVDTREVVSRPEFPEVLHDIFGITVGGERLQRLWLRALEQHETFLARS